MLRRGVLDRLLVVAALLLEVACGAPAKNGPDPISAAPAPTPAAPAKTGSDPSSVASPNQTPNPTPSPTPTAASPATPVAPPVAPPTAAKRDRPTFAVLHALPGIDVVESVNHGSHVHGGDAASIHDASINLLVTDARVHTVKVARIEMLRGHCRTTTWDSRKTLKVTGYEVHDWDTVDPIATGTTSVALPAKSDLYSVSVAFDGVSAYQACDRFAFAIRLTVDGKTVELEAPLQIKRYEPLRRP